MKTIVIGREKRAKEKNPVSLYSQIVTWKSFFSFELVFALYLFAGKYKADPRFSWIPVDITLLFFVLSLFSGVIVLKRKQFSVNKDIVGFIVAGFLFFGYCLSSLLWTPGDVYALQKTLYVCVLTLWSFLGCTVIIGSEKVRLVRFFVAWIFFATWIGIESYLAFRATNGMVNVMAMGGNYLGIGRTIGPAALLLLAVVIFSRMPIVVKGISLFMFIAACHLLLVVGGRGPLLAVVFPVVIATFLTISLRRGFSANRALFVVSLLGVLGSFYIGRLVVSGEMPVTLRRMMVLTEPDRGSSAGTRCIYIDKSFEYFDLSPIMGSGIGSWPILSKERDTRGYPHNILLEILVEFGVVGSMLFANLCIRALRNLGCLSVLRSDPLLLAILMVLINTYFNALVSGDIPDNRIFFGMLGLTVFRANGDGIL